MLHALLRFVAIEGSHFIVFRHHPLRQQALRDALCRDRLLGRGVDFDPVASGEENRLRAARFCAQDAVDRGVADEALARFHIGGVMTKADAEEIHQRECVCERKVMPQRSVSAALKARTQRVAIRRGAVVPR